MVFETITGGSTTLCKTKLALEIVVLSVTIAKGTAQFVKEIVTFKPYVAQQKALAEVLPTVKLAQINVQMPKGFLDRTTQVLDKVTK